jgi:hypothetical protein
MSEQTRFDTADIIRGLELNLAAETARADRAVKEAFGLAATLCSDPLPTEHGHMLCGAVEEQKRLRLKAEQERDRAEAACAALQAIVVRLAKQGTGVIQPTQLELDAIAVMQQPHPGSRYLELAQIVEGLPGVNEQDLREQGYPELADALARLLAWRQKEQP